MKRKIKIIFIRPYKSTFIQKDLELLKNHFDSIANLKSEGSEIAFEYLGNSKAIGEQLVKDNVAIDSQGVNNVLELGFFHAYGPINNFAK